MRDEASFVLSPFDVGVSSSPILELLIPSLLRVLSSFSELGSEEEEEEEEDEEEDEEEEQQEEWVVLLCGFSESLLSDRSDVMSAFSLFRSAFLSSSSAFLRLFAAGFILAFGSAETSMVVKHH